jgi:cytosine/adenosine deaminase-related metal-dependent hydrolase
VATYQKILATKIFDGYSFLEPNKVLIIKDDLVHEIINKENAGDDIQKIEGILCPGFINTHCHLELSYLKNKIPKNTGMVDFILAVLQGRNTALDIIVQSIKDAETEMIINGIVAVGDICNTTNTIAQKLQTNLHYTNFIELSGFSPNAAQQRFAEGKKIQQQFFQHYLNATLVPHAPYSVSNNLFALIQNENPLITTMHYNESHAEKEFMHYGTGDFQRLYKTIELDISYWAIEKNKHFKFPNALQSNILVHNVVTSDEDIVAQKNTATQTSICIC